MLKYKFSIQSSLNSMMALPKLFFFTLSFHQDSLYKNQSISELIKKEHWIEGLNCLFLLSVTRDSWFGI